MRVERGEQLGGLGHAHARVAGCERTHVLGERGRRRAGIELLPGLAHVIAVGQAERDDRA